MSELAVWSENKQFKDGNGKPTLSPAQEIALSFLLEPASERPSYEEIALCAAVPTSTLKRWIDTDALFKAEWQLRVTKQWSIPSRLQDAMDSLHLVMVGVETGSRDKIAAAKAMIEFYDRFTTAKEDDPDLPESTAEISDLQRRLASAKAATESR